MLVICSDSRFLKFCEAAQITLLTEHLFVVKRKENLSWQNPMISLHAHDKSKGAIRPHHRVQRLLAANPLLEGGITQSLFCKAGGIR